MPILSKVLFTGLLFVLFAGLTSAQAQFQGTLEINRYSVSDEGHENLKDNYNLSLSPTRILFANSGTAVDLMGAVEATSVIIRHDREDFVFIGRNEGIVLQKQELVSMIGMMKTMQGMNQGNQQSDAFSASFTETSETRSINGYEARKWLMDSKDPDETFHVWLTDGLDINWGLLSEPWLTELTLFSDLPFAEWMGEGKSPIQVERYEKDELTDRVVIENIDEKNLPSGHFDIPAGLEVLNFQQLIMKRMSGGR